MSLMNAAKYDMISNDKFLTFVVISEKNVVRAEKNVVRNSDISEKNVVYTEKNVVRNGVSSLL